MAQRRSLLRPYRQSPDASGIARGPLLSDRLWRVERVPALSQRRQSIRLAGAQRLLLAGGQFSGHRFCEAEWAANHRGLDVQQHAAVDGLLLLRYRSED